MPTSEARRSLSRLWGQKLPAGSVAFSGDELTLLSFLVGPWGPMVIAEEAGRRPGSREGTHRIPVLTDGDVGDLFVRATGANPIKGRAKSATGEAAVDDLSSAYRSKMTGQD